MNIPGYWMNEQSGILAAVVRKYLNGLVLDSGDIDIMRAYLRQWMAAPFTGGAPLEKLRRDVEAIETTRDLREWFARAMNLGIDPL